jgi:hypothetical protein
MARFSECVASRSIVIGADARGEAGERIDGMTETAPGRVGRASRSRAPRFVKKR